MSVLSVVLRIIGCVVFGLFLALAVISNGMAQFTEHDNLQHAFIGMISEQMPAPNATDFAQAKTDMMRECAGHESVNLAEMFEGAPNATVSCANVAEVASGQELVQLAAVAMFDAIYYKSYACEFVDCLTTLPEQEKPMVLVSAHANAFFKDAMMGAIALAIVGIVLIAIAMRKPFRIAKAVGIEMIFVGAVMYAVTAVVISGMLPAEAAGATVGPVVQGLIGAMASSFAIVLAAGIILAAVGFVGERLLRKEKAHRKR